MGARPNTYRKNTIKSKQQQTLSKIKPYLKDNPDTNEHRPKAGKTVWRFEKYLKYWKSI